MEWIKINIWLAHLALQCEATYATGPYLPMVATVLVNFCCSLKIRISANVQCCFAVNCISQRIEPVEVTEMLASSSVHTIPSTQGRPD